MSTNNIITVSDDICYRVGFKNLLLFDGVDVITHQLKR